MKPRGKQLVCKACFDASETHFEELVSLLKQNKPLFSAHFPPRSEVVLLDDSDEDDDDEFEGEEVELDEEVTRIVNDNDLLEEFITETMDKVNFDEQMEADKKLLEKDADEVEARIKELDERFSKVFKRLEDMHNEVYKHFKPITKSVSPIEIMDVHEFEPLHPHHTTTVKQGGLSSAVMQGGGSSSSSSSSAGGGRLVAMKKVTHFGLSPTKPKPAKDIVALDTTPAPAPLPPLPPFGVLQRPKMSKGDSVFVMRQTLFTAWGSAEVLEVMPKSADNLTSKKLGM
ncbi:hypothetical protein LSTR_LSTR011109 [Laodelphax striatellus]|uniref:Uncharacterized protein n=1 Tax=Laodelphax striatellus TaxID=195883 RepID=A0A482XDV9_LAOST|nr:hypothetical protein LSTR_LSTR011109 [Laodelphax striatellus]